jgi:uncharacterized protein (DUF1697 family)
MVGMVLHQPFLVHQQPTLVVVEEEPFREEPLEQAVQVAVETLEQAVEIIQVQAEPQTQAAAVERLLTKVRAFYLVQAAQASSSSNTQHLLNPYSHSKVLASGLHLLA